MSHARCKRVHSISLAILLVAGGLPGRVAGQARQPSVNDGDGPLVKRLRLIAAARPLEPTAGESDLRRLLKARHNSAVRRLAHDLECYNEGRATIDKLLPAVRAWRDSGLELSDAPTDHIPFLEVYWELSRRIEDIAQEELREGNASEREVELARYARLEAQIQLCRARERLKSVQSR